MYMPLLATVLWLPMIGAVFLRLFPRSATGAFKDKAALDTFPGFVPVPGEMVAGCVFAERCGLAQGRCRAEAPPIYEAGPGHGSRFDVDGLVLEGPAIAPLQVREP